MRDGPVEKLTKLFFWITLVNIDVVKKLNQMSWKQGLI